MKKLLIPIVFIVLLIAIGFYLFKKTPMVSIPESTTTTLPTTQVMPKTNPFQADVNPYSSYNNPFK